MLSDWPSLFFWKEENKRNRKQTNSKQRRNKSTHAPGLLLDAGKPQPLPTHNGWEKNKETEKQYENMHDMLGMAKEKRIGNLRDSKGCRLFSVMSRCCMTMSY